MCARGAQCGAPKIISCFSKSAVAHRGRHIISFMAQHVIRNEFIGDNGQCVTTSTKCLSKNCGTPDIRLYYTPVSGLC